MTAVDYLDPVRVGPWFAACLLPCHQPQFPVCSLRAALARGLQFTFHLWVDGWKDELVFSTAELSKATKRNT